MKSSLGQSSTSTEATKKAPIIAEVSACLVTPGITDVNFSDPLYTVELEHLHHEDIHSMTRFTVDGKVYYWNGHAELVKVETGDVIALFYPSWLVIDVQEHKLGKLVIKEESKDLMDVAVITALVVQERSDEGRQAVESLCSSVFNYHRLRWRESDPWKWVSLLLKESVGMMIKFISYNRFIENIDNIKDIRKSCVPIMIIQSN